MQVLLYDRAGHGFSSHLAKCSSYSQASNLVDLRSIVLRKENRKLFFFVGFSSIFRTRLESRENFNHRSQFRRDDRDSSDVELSLHLKKRMFVCFQYAACYPDEVSHLVAIDALPRKVVPTEMLWTSIGHRIEEELENFRQISKDQNSFSSMDKILKSFAKENKRIFRQVENFPSFRIVEKRPGIDEKHGRILLERSVREVSGLKRKMKKNRVFLLNFLFFRKSIRINARSVLENCEIFLLPENF